MDSVLKERENFKGRVTLILNDLHGRFKERGVVHWMEITEGEKGKPLVANFLLSSEPKALLRIECRPSLVHPHENFICSATLDDYEERDPNKARIYQVYEGSVPFGVGPLEDKILMGLDQRLLDVFEFIVRSGKSGEERLKFVIDSLIFLKDVMRNMQAQKEGYQLSSLG